MLSSKDASAYRSLVGRLIYLTVTRSDLSSPVEVLSQLLVHPRNDHLTAAYKVVRYLKGTIGQGIFMPANNPPILIEFCDSDRGGCKESGQSLTGYCIKCSDSYLMKVQEETNSVKSSAEAEYRSMADTCCELTWLLNLFKEFGVHNLTHVKLHCDNKSGFYISSNSVFHERTKHMEIDRHIVREKF